jgi:hypothetical protein
MYQSSVLNPIQPSQLDDLIAVSCLIGADPILFLNQQERTRQWQTAILTINH